MIWIHRFEFPVYLNALDNSEGPTEILFDGNEFELSIHRSTGKALFGWEWFEPLTRRFASRSNPRVRLFEFEIRFSNSLVRLFEIEIRFPGTGVPFQIRKPVVRELDFENRIPILILVFRIRFWFLKSESDFDFQNQILRIRFWFSRTWTTWVRRLKNSRLLLLLRNWPTGRKVPTHYERGITTTTKTETSVSEWVCVCVLA